MSVKYKQCRGYCGERKPVTAFSTHPRSGDGYRWACKPCLVRYERERRNGMKRPRLTDAQEELYEHNLARLRELIPQAKKYGRYWTHPTELVDGIEPMQGGLLLDRMAVGGFYEGWCLHVRMSSRFAIFPLASLKYTTLAMHLAEKDIKIL